MSNTLLGSLVAGALVLASGIGFAAYTFGASSTGVPPQDVVETTSTSASTTANPGGTLAVRAGAPLVKTSNLIVVSNTLAIVTGSVTPNGDQTSYWYEYGPTTSLGSQTNAQYVGSGYLRIATPGVLSGLASSTAYYARLVATNSYGAIAGDVYRFTTNTSPAPAPSVPIVHTYPAASITRTTAVLKGQILPSGPGASSWYEYGVTDALGRTTPLRAVQNATGTQTVSEPLAGLEPHTTYWYRLNAQNVYGTVVGATLSFITTGKELPKMY